MEKDKPSFKGFPYIRQMNQFVRTFAMAFNEGYIDANGNGVIEAGEDNIGHADGYGLILPEWQPANRNKIFHYDRGRWQTYEFRRFYKWTNNFRWDYG